MNSRLNVTELDKCLTDLVEWEQFGLHLKDMGNNEVNEIKKEKDKLAEQKIELFTRWLKRCVDPSWEDVVSALKIMKEHKLADEVKKRYIDRDCGDTGHGGSVLFSDQQLQDEELNNYQHQPAQQETECQSSQSQLPTGAITQTSHVYDKPPSINNRDINQEVGHTNTYTTEQVTLEYDKTDGKNDHYRRGSELSAEANYYLSSAHRETRSLLKIYEEKNKVLETKVERQQQEIEKLKSEKQHLLWAKGESDKIIHELCGKVQYYETKNIQQPHEEGNKDTETKEN